MIGKKSMTTVYVTFDEYYPYPCFQKKAEYGHTPIRVTEAEAKFLLSVSAGVDMAVELVERKLKEQEEVNND